MNSQYPLVFFEVKFLISIFSFQYLEIKKLKLFSRQKFKLKAYQKYKIGKMDFYIKMKKFIEKKPKKYKLIKEILQSSIKKLPYNYHELDSRLLSYRELLQTVYLSKIGDDEDELRKRIYNESHKKLYIKR